MPVQLGFEWRCGNASRLDRRAHVRCVCAASVRAVRRGGDSLAAVLDAFAAVYDLRTDASTGRDPYYLGNLPPECRPASTRAPHNMPTGETVRRTVAETRRRLSHPTPWFPFLAARNLRVLLDEDTLPGAELIHQALRPYWPVLWGPGGARPLRHDWQAHVRCPDRPRRPGGREL